MSICREWHVIATLLTYWFQAQNDPGHEMFPLVNLVQSSHRHNRRILRRLTKYCGRTDLGFRNRYLPVNNRYSRFESTWNYQRRFLTLPPNWWRHVDASSRKAVQLAAGRRNQSTTTHGDRRYNCVNNIPGQGKLSTGRGKTTGDVTGGNRDHRGKVLCGYEALLFLRLFPPCRYIFVKIELSLLPVNLF